MAADDRTVHARCDAYEVVRYDRSGKWYVEDVGRDRRRHVGVREAAQLAKNATRAGGSVTYGLHGGSAFQRAFERMG